VQITRGSQMALTLIWKLALTITEYGSGTPRSAGRVK
jgi:hypothetical protein